MLLGCSEVIRAMSCKPNCCRELAGARSLAFIAFQGPVSDSKATEGNRYQARSSRVVERPFTASDFEFFVRRLSLAELQLACGRSILSQASE